MGNGERAVLVDRFNVHAGDAQDGRVRKRVEPMCRYLAKPPIATERLTEVGDGDELRYELRVPHEKLSLPFPMMRRA
jgi:hypothetical protein